MDVILEFEKIKDPYCGLGQWCLHLGNELVQNNKDPLSLGFYLPKEKFQKFSYLGPLFPLRKFHRQLPFFLPKTKIWHSVHQDSRFIPREGSGKFVLTIHDLNGYFERGRDEAYLEDLQKKIKRADALTYISKFTKTQVEEFLEVTKSKPSYVIHNGISLKKCAHSQERPKKAPAGGFLFSIGTVVPKKNFHVLVEFLKLFKDLKIVLAGTLFHSYASDLKRKILEAGLEDRFILCGEVTEEEKYWYYENCEAFIFPSLFEGFGLPVTEAMHFGKPLFLSNRTSLPEVGGDLAYYFEDFEPHSMKEVYDKGMKDFRENKPILVRKLKERSLLFSWENAAKEYLEVYKNLL